MTDIWPPFRTDDGELNKPKDHEIWANAHPNVKQFSEGICARLVHPNCVFVDVCCIGPGPVNEGIKAVAISREKLSEHGIDLFVVPFFSETVTKEGAERTRLVLRVFKEGGVDG